MESVYTPRSSLSAPRKIARSRTPSAVYRGPSQKSRSVAKRLRSNAAVLERTNNRAQPQMSVAEGPASLKSQVGFHGIRHVGLLCDNLETSLDFYQNVLGLKVNRDRPDKKLPYRGAWLWIGSEMIHLMELPKPDANHGQPEHGNRGKHICIGVESLSLLVQRLADAGVKYTENISGRPAVCFRDPDMNCLEMFESKQWR